MCPDPQRSRKSVIHCVPLRARGREAGLFSFIFSSEPRLDDSSRVPVRDHAPGRTRTGRSRARPTGLFPAIFQFPARVDREIQSLLPQIETRAILGERTRLAREIHDGLAQTLAFLKIEIGRAENLLAQGKSEQASRILKDSSRTISDAYLDARQAIENLRRAPDDHLETGFVRSWRTLKNYPVCRWKWTCVLKMIFPPAYRCN